MVSTPRFWRVEHPSWSGIYRVPEALGPRPNAADVEIVGHAVAYTDAGIWRFLTFGFDERWVSTVRIAPWPRDRGAFMALERSDLWRPARFVADAAAWTALPQVARGALRDAVHWEKVHWEKVPGAMRSDLVVRAETGILVRALACSYGVVLEEERDS